MDPQATSDRHINGSIESVGQTSAVVRPNTGLVIGQLRRVMLLKAADEMYDTAVVCVEPVNEGPNV